MKPLIFSFSLLLFFYGGYSQNVGIGTATPDTSAVLHIDISSSTTKGLLVNGTFNLLTSTVPNLGAGSRMMFYPGKAAFRAGRVDGLQWDNANVGFYSFAIGNSTTASGYSSAAMGFNTIAGGDVSTAMGAGTNASGNNSAAMGQNTIASGNNSVAMGAATNATGYSSTAMGFNTNATGYSSTAMGTGTTAKAHSSFSIGSNNDNADNPSGTTPVSSDRIFQIGNGDITTGAHSNALTVLRNGNTGIGTPTPDASALLHLDIGTSTTKGLLVNGTIGAGSTVPNLGTGSRMMFYPGKAAFRAGYVDGSQWDNSNVGFFSTATGFNTTASGTGSIAMGQGTTASGSSATAMGFNTIASGLFSTAMGQGTTAGDNSTAMGFNTIASGASSTAMGQSAIASGDYSTSIGFGTSASGYASTAIGRGLFAKAIYAVSIGNNNDEDDNPSPSVALASDRIFQIGNGGTFTRSNAMTVLRNGNTGIGTSTPASPLSFADPFGDKISLRGNSGAHYGLGIQNLLMQIHTDIAAADIAFGYGSSIAFTETMRITGSGNVGIGILNPNAPLAFRNTTGKKISLYESAFNSQYGFAVQGGQLQIYSDAAAAKISFGYYNSGTYTERMFLTNSSGILTVAGTNYPSDARYKKQITRLQNPLQKIMAINGVEYFMRTDEFPAKHFSDELQVGLIAQEVEKVLPQVVQTNEDGYKAIDYAKVVPLLVEGIKEQQKQINSLLIHDKKQEKQIDELKKLLEKLIKK